jgi:hypothetical protein
MTTDRHNQDGAHIALPQLSDDAVVQIHDFIYFCLDLFEARYGDQIHRRHQAYSHDDSWEPPDLPDGAEPPF